MKREFYLQTSRIEDEHWWFRHRRRIADRWLARSRGGRNWEVALDVGCGTGGNLELLQAHCGCVTGLDRSAYALDLARGKHPLATLVQGDANAIGEQFKAESFDLIAVFNVLYHRWIEDDGAVLRDLAALLRPGGVLFLTEPAFPSLFRRHDVLDDGLRRYRLPALVAGVEMTGLLVRGATYFNLPALPFAFARAKLESRQGGLQRPVEQGEEAGEMSLPAPWINRSIYTLMGLERAWLAGVGRLPAGVTAMLLAERPVRS